VSRISERFRGFLPVVIDVETGGFNCHTDAILEIAGTILRMDSSGHLEVHATHQSIAEELGSTREVVSRVLKDLEHADLIALARGRIELRDTAALRKLGAP